MDVVLFVYYGRVNDDVFETALKSLRRHSKALLQVHSDDIPEEWIGRYGIDYHKLDPDDIKGIRCLRKMLCVQDAISKLKDGDRLVVCDADLYFLDDPFKAFEKCKFDVGATLRLHSYPYPVNSGVFFVRICKATRILFGKEFNKYASLHTCCHDWFVDQKYLCFLFIFSTTVDVGWEYNFCPNTDVFGVKLARDMIRRAYESRSVKILHLKSELKLCIYDGYMEDAVNNNPNGIWNWKKYGEAEYSVPVPEGK